MARCCTNIMPMSRDKLTKFSFNYSNSIISTGRSETTYLFNFSYSHEIICIPASSILMRYEVVLLI